MSSEEFRERVKSENKKVVSGLMEDGEKLEFSVCGYNIDALYSRAATIGFGLFIPIGYVAGYLLNDHADYANWAFTDRSLIVLNCNNYGQIVSYKRLTFVTIKEAILFTKTSTIKVETIADEKLAIEFDKDVAEDCIQKVETKLQLKKEEKRYSSAAKTAYGAALAGSIVKGIGIGIGTFIDIDRLKN